jgi:hypothetical protein
MNLGIMPHCLDFPKPTKITLESFDGAKWEEAIEKNKDIKNRSKTSNK